MTIQNDAASFEAALRLCATRDDVRILRRVRPISALANDLRMESHQVGRPVDDRWGLCR